MPEPAMNEPAVHHRHRHRARHGFTLLEVLIAIALILALSGTMFGFLFDMFNSRHRAREYSARQRAASTLIDRVESDLATCIVGDAQSGPGVWGDSTHLHVLTRSVLTSAAQSNADDAENFSDLQQAEYRFLPGAQRLEAQRSAVGVRNSAGPFSRGFLPLHDPAVTLPRVRFRYFDGQQWGDRFDSVQSGSLPVAVEVAVWFSSAAAAEPNADQDQDFALSTSAPTQTQPAQDVQRRATRSDDSTTEPPADRMRVIVLLDARNDDDEESQAASGSPSLQALAGERP
jgi:prepilin-type N-terminal cleavage/methylation domain-containing protein